MRYHCSSSFTRSHSLAAPFNCTQTFCNYIFNAPTPFARQCPKPQAESPTRTSCFPFIIAACSAANTAPRRANTPFSPAPSADFYAASSSPSTVLGFAFWPRGTSRDIQFTTYRLRYTTTSSHFSPCGGSEFRLPRRG